MLRYALWTGSVLEGARLGTPLPPCKKLQIEFAREAAYRMSLIEVRLGGWGIEGPKGPTLGRHASACATILRLRALLYLGCVRYYTCVRHISACASIL